MYQRRKPKLLIIRVTQNGYTLDYLVIRSDMEIKKNYVRPPFLYLKVFTFIHIYVEARALPVVMRMHARRSFVCLLPQQRTLPHNIVPEDILARACSTNARTVGLIRPQ